IQKPKKPEAISAPAFFGTHKSLLDALDGALVAFNGYIDGTENNEVFSFNGVTRSYDDVCARRLNGLVSCCRLGLGNRIAKGQATAGGSTVGNAVRELLVATDGEEQNLGNGSLARNLLAYFNVCFHVCLQRSSNRHGAGAYVEGGTTGHSAGQNEC